MSYFLTTFTKSKRIKVKTRHLSRLLSQEPTHEYTIYIDKSLYSYTLGLNEADPLNNRGTSYSWILFLFGTFYDYTITSV